MPHRTFNHLLQILVLLSIIEQLCNLNKLRIPWTWKHPHLEDIYKHITYDADLQILSRMTLDTFNYFTERMAKYITWSRSWYTNVDDLNCDEYDGRMMSCILSPHDRILQWLMFNTNHSVDSLHKTFGMGKSITIIIAS